MAEPAFEDLPYQEAVQALQKAQVMLAVENGMRAEAAKAQDLEDWHKAFRLVAGMLLTAGLLFSAASAADMEAARLRFLLFGGGLLLNELYYRFHRRQRLATIARGNAQADAYRAAHADLLFFVEPGDYAPHLVNELLKILHAHKADSLKGALEVYDGRISGQGRPFTEEEGEEE